MPLASWFNLHYYGEASSAMRTGGVGVAIPTPKATARMAEVTTGVGSVPFAKPTRLRNSPMITSGVGTMVRALPKARVQPQLVVKVGQLSQDDVTGAVQTATIEPGLSLAEAIRLLVAVAVGKTNIVDLGGGNATVEFRDSNDSKNRVVATMAGSERTNVTLDKT